MDDHTIGAAIERAERAAEAVRDRELRPKAFEVILGRLLIAEGIAGSISEHRRRTSDSAPRALERTHTGKTEPTTLTQRILTLRDDDHFREPRTISDVREALKVKGWHYPVTTLSGALQGLIQKRELRRERCRDGNKMLWKYSNP